MKRSRYMHTLDGRPAQFNGEQLVYRTRSVRLVPTLAQVREEQAASRDFRTACGCGDRRDGYGYIRVA